MYICIYIYTFIYAQTHIYTRTHKILDFLPTGMRITSACTLH